MCDQFLARLQERGDIDIGAPGFIESICQHFERLPTRYALDVNTDSLDVLSHKRLLDEARLDPTTVSFAVRSVEVLHSRPRESSDGLPSPAFHEVSSIDTAEMPSFWITLMVAVCGIADHCHASADVARMLPSCNILWRLNSMPGCFKGRSAQMLAATAGLHCCPAGISS